MGTILFPSLSTDGFIEDRNIIIKKVLEMFIASHENQSNFFSIKSYKYIINNYEAGFTASDEIKKALVDMYSHYFESSTIDVTSTFNEDESIYYYTISITAIYNGKTYSLTKEMAEDIIIN